MWMFVRIKSVYIFCYNCDDSWSLIRWVLRSNNSHYSTKSIFSSYWRLIKDPIPFFHFVTILASERAQVNQSINWYINVFIHRFTYQITFYFRPLHFVFVDVNLSIPTCFELLYACVRWCDCMRGSNLYLVTMLNFGVRYLLGVVVDMCSSSKIDGSRQSKVYTSAQNL